MRPPPPPDVMKALAELANDPEFAELAAASRVPEECPEGHMFCPHCGQLHETDSLLRLEIRTPRNTPDASVSSGLLCSFPACLQPIWLETIGAEAPGADQG